MKIKRRIIGALTASAILIPTLAMVVSCSCGNGGDEPGPGPTPPTPPEPTDTVNINFTSTDPNVKISKNQISVKKGTTYGDIKDLPTATKTDEGKQWEFKWWYRDGYSETSEITKDVTINTEITLHPYFEEKYVPKVCRITLDNGGDSDVTIYPSTTVFKVEENTTTFKQFIDKNQISAEKAGSGWKLDRWTEESILPPADWPEETTYLYKPTEIGDDFIINSDMTIHPFFINENDEWVDKTIVWEQDDDGEDVDKNTILPEHQNGTSIAHFLIPDKEEKPVTLGVNDSVKVWVTKDESLSSDVFGNTTLSPATAIDATVQSNRISVPVDAVNLPTGDYYEENKLVFDVHFQYYWHNEPKGAQIDFEGLSFQFTKPYLTSHITYVPVPGQDIQQLSSSDSGVFIDSAAIAQKSGTGYFELNRPLGTNEGIKVELFDADTSEPVSNIETSVSAIDVGEGTNLKTYVNLGIYFKKIESLFEYHRVNFKLLFTITNNETGIPEESPIDNTFQLEYVPDEAISPYKLVCKKEYKNQSYSTMLTFPVQIENNLTPRFEESDHLIIENHAQRTDPEAPGYSPIVFVNPDQKLGARLDGTGRNDAQLTVRYDFEDMGSLDPRWTKDVIYSTPVTFKFFRGDKPVNSIDMVIDFGFNLTQDESNLDSWAQAQSIGIVQTAKNVSTQQKETSLATGWIINYDLLFNIDLHNRSWTFATAYNVQKDYEKFETSAYTDHTFGITFNSLAAPRFVYDDTPYIIIDDDGSGASVDNDNNDILEFYSTAIHFPSLSQTDYFTWDTPSLFSTVAPNITVFNVFMDSEHIIPTDTNKVIHDNFIKQDYKFYSTYNTVQQTNYDLHLITLEQKGRGQVAAVYEDINNFKTNDFVNGYTGGFSSETITLPGNKTAKALVWKSFNMPMGGNYLFKTDWSTYVGGCTDAYNTLYQGNGHKVKHLANAFTMWDASFKKSEYFDEAGRGAMFVVQKKIPGTRDADYPLIAGINWNGESRLNLSGRITPYFDTFIDYSDDNGNLLEKFLTAQFPLPW